MRVLNTKSVENELPVATDQECQERREFLVKRGVIKPADKLSIINRKSSPPLLSTRAANKEMRRKFIEQGIIKPMMNMLSMKATFCELAPRGKRPCSSEEGEYRPRPIESDEEYFRRRQAYFRAIQEIFYARKKLKLVLGKKRENDPDWYF